MKYCPVLLILCLWSLVTLAEEPASTVPSPVPSPPSIDAQAYLLQDFHSQRLLMKKNADEQMEPASLTKLMTAYLVFEALNKGQIQLADKVKISENAWRAPGSRMYIEVNKEVLVEDLIKGMIIQSGNDASLALAEFIAGSEESFVKQMNEKAEEIGLSGTHYQNSTGLPAENHYTTPHDMLQMTRRLIIDFPEMYSLYSEREFTYNNITQSNRNSLLWRDRTVDGVKTGYTEAAGYCLIASAQRGGMRLISVVMGTDSKKKRATESEKMLDYGFRFFETYQLYKAHQTLVSERVWQGAAEQINLGIGETLYITIPRDQYSQLKAVLDINRPVTAPIRIDDVLGNLRIMLNDEQVARHSLIALDAVERGNFWRQISDYVLLWFE